MKTTKPAVILLALVLLLTAATAQSAEKPAKKEISNTRIASCLVKVTSDPSVLPLNEFAIDYLVRSSGVAGKAARDILDISPDVASEFIEIDDVYAVDLALGDMPGTTVSSRRFPTTARTPARPAATRTTRPGSTTSPTRPKPRTPTSPPPRRKPTVTQPLRSTTEQTILFHLRVDFSFSDNAEDIKPAAEEFMVALIENLRSALSGAFDQYSAKYSAKLNKQLKLADEETARAEVDLIQMQDQLRNISGSRDLSRQSILSGIRNLRQKLQSTILQRASDETLYEATAKRIANTEAKRKALAVNDTITRELKSILDVHEERLKETQKLYDAGNASAANIQDIREKIIRSRIELAQRREQIINPPGSIEISSLNDEMASLATNMALTRQEKHSLEEQLEEAKDLLKIADRYELLSLKAGIAKQSLEEALLWRARLGRDIRSIQPPDVTVIGAE